MGDDSMTVSYADTLLMFSLCPLQTQKSFDHRSLRARMQGRELPELKWTDVRREWWVEALHFVSPPKAGTGGWSLWLADVKYV